MIRSCTFLSIAGVIGVLALLPQRASAIETIDCQRDQNRAEQTICASQELQILDAIVTQAYADVMHDAYVPGRIKNRLQFSQRSFLAQRDGCGRNVWCLDGTMRDRLAQIRAIGLKAAAY